MARLPRFVIPGHPQHVIVRNDGEKDTNQEQVSEGIQILRSEQGRQGRAQSCQSGDQ